MSQRGAVSWVYGDALEEVVVRVMRQVLAADARVVERKRSRDNKAPYEVSGIVGLTGATQGNIVISFPLDVARWVTAAMLREEDPEECTHQDVADCVGELTNIVAGNLLGLIDEQAARSTNLSLPSVVIGNHRVVWNSKDGPGDLLIFRFDAGIFATETNLREAVPAGEE
jgi:CheY-specific phosphatase CheX